MHVWWEFEDSPPPVSRIDLVARRSDWLIVDRELS